VSAGGGGVALGDSPTWTGNHTWNGTTNIFNGTNFQIGATTIVIGDATTDNVTINAKLQTAFLPDGNNIDLGDSSNKWRNIYLNSGAGTSKLYFDGGGDTYITGSGTSGRINIFSDASNVAAFLPTSISLFQNLGMGSNDITSCGEIQFGSTSAISGTDYGWSGLTGDVYGNVQSGDSYFLREAGTTIVEIDNDGIDIRTGWLEMTQITAPSGLSGHTRIYMDNLSGTQRLMANVNGVTTILATD